LRKGLTWHNGDPLTAHDVKFSLERTRSPESLASRAAILRRDVERIQVVDDHPVCVYINRMHHDVPAGLSRAGSQEGQLMPQKYIETVGWRPFGRNRSVVAAGNSSGWSGETASSTRP
jgi:peptide/nickel transport system substrate-binding protein